MSSTESSGASAEATATTPAPAAALPAFGSTRGSGLARGKRPATGPVSSASATATEYTPTAIEVVSAPREYQNPFAPVNPEPAARVEMPAAVIPEPAVAPAPVTPARPEPVEQVAEAAPAAETDEPAELNILPPEQPKTVPAQTWESEGFRPAREPRTDRPRREERSERAPREDQAPREERAPREEIPTPAKFLYVRPGYNYVPTPSNYGGAPRERSERPAHGSPERALETSAATASAPAKSGGFMGWLKSLFGGAPAAPAAGETRGEESRHDGSREPGRHRGGRGRSQGGSGQYASNGEGGQRRRHRGGRGRSGPRGERSEGSSQGGV